MNYFVTAIGTDSGKTLVSAILCQALNADYWKPIQAGVPRDAESVKDLTSDELIIHPEAYLLKTPASPHAAAKIDKIELLLKNFIPPSTKNDLVIEGAGGCLVPINDSEFMIDFISHFQCSAIVVANLYLGSINHTLLTMEALQRRNIPIKGIIFNGESNEESERIILLHTKVKCLLRVPREPHINKTTIIKYASQLKANWNE